MASSETDGQDNPQDLSGQTVAELLGLLNEHMLSATEESAKTTYLHQPSSEKDIQARAKRLISRHGLCALDPDYVDFLKISNGFYLDQQEQEVLYDAARVEVEDSVDFHLFRANPILHPLPGDLWKKFDWDDGVGVNLGPAGDEGNLWMFGPMELQLVIKQFDRIYPTLTDDEKRLVNDLIEERYGSEEAMRAQQFTVMEFYHWSPIVKFHLGFRAYLEELVRMAVSREDPHEYFLS